MIRRNIFDALIEPFQNLAREQERWKEAQLQQQRKAQETEQKAQREAEAEAAKKAEEAAKKDEETAKKAEEAAEKAEDASKCDLMRQHIMQLKAERVKRIKAAETGSAEYLKARYGDYAFSSMRTVVIKELELTEEKATVFLQKHYFEAMWKEWEDDDIERLLGNR